MATGGLTGPLVAGTGPQHRVLRGGAFNNTDRNVRRAVQQEPPEQPFLGFVTERRRLKRRNAAHARRRLRGLAALLEAGLIGVADVTASVRG